MSEPRCISNPLKPIPGLQIKALHDARVLEKLRILEGASLAVKYNQNHYLNIVACGIPRFNCLAFYNDILVGSCTCRLELVEEPEKYRLYVMTLCVLKPYRRMGIASRLIEAIINNVYTETSITIIGVYLNVQTSSTSALEFYRTFDFEQVETVKDYYIDLDCNDAYSLRLVVPQPYLAKTGKKKK